MSTRKTAVAKAKAKPAPAVEAPTQLRTLDENQAALIAQTIARRDQIAAALQEANRELNEKLALLAPPGANGFDPQTMSFFSQPPQPPILEDN